VSPEKPLPSCDSCGIAATQEHLLRRTTRLEFATRYRPIHIQVLALAVAPTVRLEDCFYNDATEVAERSVEEQEFARAMLEAAGLRRGGQPWKEMLAEFQAAGWFLAYCVECPAEEWGEEVGASDEAIAARFAPSLRLRIIHSYKPKQIVAMGPGMEAFGQILAVDFGSKIHMEPGPHCAWRAEV
jgi:hypothetical protein